MRELCRQDPGYVDGGGRGHREGAGPDPGAHSGRVVPAEMQRLPSEPVDKGQDTGQSLCSLCYKMKRLGQSRNDTQLWMCLVVKVKSNAVKKILYRNLEC